MTNEDEVLVLLREGIREVGEEVDLAHLSYENEDDGRIRYEGPLPEALRPGVVVGRFKPETTMSNTGRQVGDNLRLLRANAERLAKSLTRGLMLAERMAGTRPRTIVIDHEVTADTPHRITAVVEVDTLDDTLKPGITLAFVEEGGFYGDRHMMQTLRGQKRRRSAVAGGLMVEGALARAAGDALRPLTAHLRRMPQDPNVQAWESGAWTAKRLADHGIRLPVRLETVRVKDGRIFGRIRLSENTTWTDGTLIHRDSTLPITAMQALAGKPLATLIVDDILPPDATMSEVSVDGRGRVRARTRPVDEPAPA